MQILLRYVPLEIKPEAPQSQRLEIIVEGGASECVWRGGRGAVSGESGPQPRARKKKKKEDETKSN